MSLVEILYCRHVGVPDSGRKTSPSTPTRCPSQRPPALRPGGLGDFSFRAGCEPWVGVRRKRTVNISVVKRPSLLSINFLRIHSILNSTSKYLIWNKTVGLSCLTVPHLTTHSTTPFTPSGHLRLTSVCCGRTVRSGSLRQRARSSSLKKRERVSLRRRPVPRTVLYRPRVPWGSLTGYVRRLRDWVSSGSRHSSFMSYWKPFVSRKKMS